MSVAEADRVIFSDDPEAYKRDPRMRKWSWCEFATITDRHRRIIEMRVEGHTHREIAETLGYSVQSVTKTLASPMGKLALQEERERVRAARLLPHKQLAEATQDAIDFLHGTVRDGVMKVVVDDQGQEQEVIQVAKVGDRIAAANSLLDRRESTAKVTKQQHQGGGSLVDQGLLAAVKARLQQSNEERAAVIDVTPQEGEAEEHSEAPELTHGTSCRGDTPLQRGEGESDEFSEST